MSDKFKELRDKYGPLIKYASFCNECRDWFKTLNYIKCPDCNPIKKEKSTGIVHIGKDLKIEKVVFDDEK